MPASLLVSGLDTLDLSALPLRPEDQRMIDDSSMLAKEPPHLKAAVQLVVKNQPTYKCVDLMFRPGFHERQVFYAQRWRGRVDRGQGTRR